MTFITRLDVSVNNGCEGCNHDADMIFL